MKATEADISSSMDTGSVDADSPSPQNKATALFHMELDFFVVSFGSVAKYIDNVFFFYQKNSLPE